MSTYYMAVDIGASNGRSILGWLEDGKIRLQEIHRFTNGPVETNRGMVWDVDHLFREIVAGLRIASDLGKRPERLGIDTWGVDFVLLDENDALLGDAVCYRDARTRGMQDKMHGIISEKELYARTGIQSLTFNTLYQLLAIQTRTPEHLDRARSFLMMPEYLHFLLTGAKVNEYTIASTSEMLDADARDWDRDLLRAVGLPEGIFHTPRQPGTPVGALRPEIRQQIGYDLKVVLPPCHDTAAAVLAVPAENEGETIYLSSGTWSLMGIENAKPDRRDECRLAGFTNEGGYNRRYRFLKNIMGLWIVQSLRREIAPDHGFGELIAQARQGMDCQALFDVNADDFLAPASMKQAILDHCSRSDGPVPGSNAQILACAFKSLAASYADTVREIEMLSGRTYDSVNIVGGGSQDDFLNALTAETTGKTICAGPVEATAIGNILSQMLGDGVFADVSSARRAVRESFEVRKI